MNNYYVRRTGDNSDYLEHALLGFSASGGTVHNRSGSHKYIAKFNVGGRTRYIYDPRELAAYQAAKSGISRVARAGSNFARNKIGIGLKREMNIAKYRADEESKSASKFVGSGRTRGSNGDVRQKGADPWYSDNARENARNYAREAVKKYRDIQGEYNRSLIGRAENLGNKARKMAGDLSSNARNAGKSFAGSISREAYKVKNKVDTKIGNNQKKAYEKAKQKYAELDNRLGSERLDWRNDRIYKNGKVPQWQEARNDYDVARKRYQKTPRYKLEKAAEQIGRRVDRAVTPVRRKAKRAYLKATAKTRKG